MGWPLFWGNTGEARPRRHAGSARHAFDQNKSCRLATPGRRPVRASRKFRGRHGQSLHFALSEVSASAMRHTLAHDKARQKALPI